MPRKDIHQPFKDWAAAGLYFRLESDPVWGWGRGRFAEASLRVVDGVQGNRVSLLWEGE